jgi:hypothetical protein
MESGVKGVVHCSQDYTGQTLDLGREGATASTTSVREVTVSCLQQTLGLLRRPPTPHPQTTRSHNPSDEPSHSHGLSSHPALYLSQNTEWEQSWFPTQDALEPCSHLPRTGFPPECLLYHPGLEQMPRHKIS